MHNISETLKSLFTSGQGVVLAVIAILAPIVILLEKFTKLREQLGYRSLADKIRDEEARITEAIQFMKGLESENSEESRAMRAKLQANLNSMLAGLAALTDRDSKLRQDPNYDLNFVQRLFLLFAPEGGTALVLHSFAYICMMAIPIALIYKSYLPPQQAGVAYVVDTLLSACYGALVFRAWALAARRWTYAYHAKPGFWRKLFFVRRPENRWMMVAQVFLGISIFWVIESVEDLCLDILATGEPPPWPEELLKFLVPLAAGVLCWLWASAELKCAGTGSDLWQRLLPFWRLRWTTVAMMAGITGLASFTVLMIRMRLLDEPLHEVALVLQSLILCVACSQLSVVLSRRDTLNEQDPLPGKPQSAAA